MHDCTRINGDLTLLEFGITPPHHETKQGGVAKTPPFPGIQ